MERREFIKMLGTGAVGAMLGGCGFLADSSAAVPKAELPASSTAVVSGGGNNKMKITVITGSPHERGTSFLLADKFIEGAEAAGHEVFRFNAAFEDINPCRGCDHCGMNGPCVYDDAVSRQLMPHLLEADVIALITPLYYFGMSAQLKTVLDRFYAKAASLNGSSKRTVLMATAYDDREKVMDALVHHYKAWAEYHSWQDAGMVLAVGCGARRQIEASQYPEEAYKLGLNL